MFSFGQFITGYDICKRDDRVEPFDRNKRKIKTCRIPSTTPHPPLTLPEDLFDYIMQFLEMKTHICDLTRVCKAWRRAPPKEMGVWTEFQLDRLKPWITPGARLSISCLRNTTVAAQLLEGSLFTDLTLYGRPVTDGDIKILCTSPLRSLRLRNGALLTDVTCEHLCRTNLKHLSITSCSHFTDKSTEYLRKLSLHTLKIHEFYSLTDQGLENIVLSGVHILAVRTSFRIRSLPRLDSCNLTRLEFTLCGISSDGLAPLRTCPLQFLSLFGCENVKYLPNLDGCPLKELQIMGCPFGGEYAANLRHLKCLTELHIIDCIKFDDVSMKYVGELANLEYLGLRRCSVTDEGFRFLSQPSPEHPQFGGKVEKLKSLYVSSSSHITANCLEYLADLPIESLSFEKCLVRTCAAFCTIQSKRLKFLSLWECDTKDISHLAKLKIECLRLSKMSITDEDLPFIAEIEDLREAHFRECKVTEEGIVTHLRSTPIVYTSV